MKDEFLLRAYSSVEGHIQRFRLLVHNDMSGEHTVREHQAIIAAFRAAVLVVATKLVQGFSTGRRRSRADP